jgi:hypothetical protein
MSIEGRWNVTMDTPVGTLNFTWSFVNENGRWSGRMPGQGVIKDSDLRDIDVRGDAVSFATTTQSPMGPLDLSFTGAPAAHEMPGVCRSRFGEFRFSATRA